MIWLLAFIAVGATVAAVGAGVCCHRLQTERDQAQRLNDTYKAIIARQTAEVMALRYPPYTENVR